MTALDKRKVAVIATDGFEESELTEPLKALKEAGVTALVLAPEEGEIQGFKHDVKGTKVKVDRKLASARPEEFDAVVLPGGALNADVMRMDRSLRGFLTEMDRAGKPIAAICHAGWELVSAGLVKGRKLTSYHTIQDDIRNAGGEWVDEEVVVDRNWITSRKPDDLPAFNKALLGMLGNGKRTEEPTARRAAANPRAEHGSAPPA